MEQPHGPAAKDSFDKDQSMKSAVFCPASRALMHMSARSSFEPEALAVSFALSGLSLFEKLRSAVRKHRS